MVKKFYLVVRLEGVRILLAYATHRGFKVYQMDAKFAFLKKFLMRKSTLNNLKVL